MLSLIEVKCPHCGVQGQIMTPPLGSIIVGPCPECSEMVVVFCGQVMPLDKGIMAEGSLTEKQEHLLEVLGVFLQGRVEKLFQPGADGMIPGPVENPMDLAEDEMQDMQALEAAAGRPISDDEMNSFVHVDLKMLDNPEYFKAIFEKA